MPHLRFRGIEKTEVKSISGDLVKELANIVGCPTDHFTLEHIETTFIVEGGSSEPYPFVEVLWFSRGPEVQNKVAKVINSKIKELQHDLICITFTELAPENYYEYGESL